MSTKRVVLSVAVIAVVAVLLLWLSAPRSPAPGPTVTGDGARPEQEHFPLAMDCLDRLDEFDPEKSMMRAAYHLNLWMATSEDDVPWQADPLIAQLPRHLRDIEPLQQLDKRQFTTEEVRHLQQASWARSISQWVTQRGRPLEIDAWLEQLEQAKGEPHAYDVSVAARLFDWTVRNVQLDELLPYPQKPAGPDQNSERGASAPVSPLLTATPGPGYTAFPWQTMLFGRGDAWQRARVFILLCQQQQIDVVMLALKDMHSAPRPWAAAALIDDQLYLFDPGLGIPIPDADGVGIATLDLALADESLLRSLAMGDSYPYEAADADLSQLVALIDASPEALSYRMKAVEVQASTDEPLILSVNASELADRLGQRPGISTVQLWRTPFEACVYRTAMILRAREDFEITRKLMFEEWITGNQHPLVQGRVQYFRGNFEKTDDNPGAKSYFVNAIIPDSVIREIETSPKVQQELGIVRNRENDQQWQIALQLHKATITSIKQTATYWLGITHYETGRYDTAEGWLKKRTLESAGDNPWKTGARYNLSRNYEAMGDLEQARKLLLLDESPQKHGNLLRARYLRRLMESTDDGAEAGE
jgi:tetratricopeptide (TPR) repeat protein